MSLPVFIFSFELIAEIRSFSELHVFNTYLKINITEDNARVTSQLGHKSAWIFIFINHTDVQQSQLASTIIKFVS